METPEATSSDAGCTLQDLLPHLGERVGPLLRLRLAIVGPERPGPEPGKRLYGALAEEARNLEVFLDDHGAWSNSALVYLIEYVASMRGFAIVGYTLHHIEDRLGRQYEIEDAQLCEEFEGATRETRAFIDRCIRTLMRETTKQLEELFQDLPPVSPWRADPNRTRVPKSRLPADLQPFTPGDRRRRVVEIGGKYVAHKRILERESKQRVFDDTMEMRRYVAEISDEEECRFFETRVQNLLARYDTYIKGSSLEAEDSNLSRIRGYVALVRRLARVITELVHYFERHENDVRCAAVTSRMMELIDRDLVLERALNYGIYYVHAFMDQGLPLVTRALTTYSQQTRISLPVPDSVQLHIRPVSLIAKIVEHHKAPVNVIVGDSSCYAGSIVQVLMTLGAQPDAREIAFEGDQAALDHIRLLFESGLGEDGQAGLPQELAYLRS